jgi:hypothetical protein
MTRLPGHQEGVYLLETSSMEVTVLDSPRLNFIQDELLEGIKFCREEIQKELQRLPTRPPDNLYLNELAAYYEGPEFSRLRKLRKENDNLSVRAIRSLFRRVPGQKGYPGICMKLLEDKEGNYEVSFVPGDGIEYHPGLPRWALEHFCLWIHEKRWIRSDENYYLLADCKMGLETGLKPPKDLALLEKVLLARGFDIHSEKVIEKLTRHRPFAKKLKGNKSRSGRPKKRVRKVSNSWDQIASELVKLAKEGSIPTTGEGLKILLQEMFTNYDFDKV